MLTEQASSRNSLCAVGLMGWERWHGAVRCGVGRADQVEERGRLVREMAGDSVVDIAEDPADPDNLPAGVRDALSMHNMSSAASTLHRGGGRDLAMLWSAWREAGG